MLGSISDIRRDYMLKSFDESHAADNPFDQFREWWDEATSADIDEVNAMTLATVDANGKPAARIVLLKGYTHEGFVFLPTMKVPKVRILPSIQMQRSCFSGKNWRDKPE